MSPPVLTFQYTIPRINGPYSTESQKRGSENTSVHHVGLGCMNLVSFQSGELRGCDYHGVTSGPCSPKRKLWLALVSLTVVCPAACLYFYSQRGMEMQAELRSHDHDFPAFWSQNLLMLTVCVCVLNLLILYSNLTLNRFANIS